MLNIYNYSIIDLFNMLFDKINECLHIGIPRLDFSVLSSLLLITASISFIILIIMWLLKAIGLYTIAKNKGDQFAYLAFVPLFCLYTQGKIVGNTKIFGIDIQKAEWLLPFLLISKCIPVVGMFSGILFILAYFALLYRIYQIYIPNLAIVFLILSIIFPIVQPFFIFFIKNNKNTQTN